MIKLDVSSSDEASDSAWPAPWPRSTWDFGHSLAAEVVLQEIRFQGNLCLRDVWWAQCVQYVYVYRYVYIYIYSCVDVMLMYLCMYILYIYMDCDYSMVPLMLTWHGFLADEFLIFNLPGLSRIIISAPCIFRMRYIGEKQSHAQEWFRLVISVAYEIPNIS